MPAARPISFVSRRDPAVVALALAWRDLTGGRARGRDLCRRTILACSGGGDSCGMVAGLAGAVAGSREIFVVAHIVHDMRGREEALGDRDAARALARSLGLSFAEATISVRAAGGNAEATARRLRYAALAELAREHRCHFIATAHHAQDQLETMLMGLLRGAGPHGMRGIASARRLPKGELRLIRPALDLETADLRRLCKQSGIVWREDATNLDTTRIRAAIRQRIAPELDRLRPGIARRASRTARLIAATEGVLADRIAAVLADGRQTGGFSWKRGLLREERGVVIGGVLRAAAGELRAGKGRDRLGSRTMAPIIRSIRNSTTDPRRFELAGLSLSITAQRVELLSMERSQ